MRRGGRAAHKEAHKDKADGGAGRVVHPQVTDVAERARDAHLTGALFHLEFEGLAEGRDGARIDALAPPRADGALYTRLFQKGRHDMPVRHLVDVLERGAGAGETAYADLPRLDLYSLGVVIYEYVASAVEGNIVTGADVAGGRADFWAGEPNTHGGAGGVGSAGGAGAGSAGRKRARGADARYGWASCRRWQVQIPRRASRAPGCERGPA